MASVPGLRSSYEKVGGLVYFGRMLDKIRLHAAGKLPDGYFLGDDTDPTWFDGRICRFLQVKYADVVERTLAGGSDEDVLDWCFAKGRKPNDEEILIFNSFLSKRGWRDGPPSQALETEKAELGFAGRSDIRTFFDLQDADEERPLRFAAEP